MSGLQFGRVHELLEQACGVEFTAAVARIEQSGKVRFEGAYGVTRADHNAAPVYADTLFDLASLTKLFVSTLVLETTLNGKASLDEPLSRALPEWRQGPHAAITARMLLAHTSGMNSGADYRAILDENIERFALCAPLIATPGQRVIYSDLGFIVLGIALERIHHRSLASLVRESFGASPTFRPRLRKRVTIPATEDDAWRGRVQGSVHDEKAHLMGGVAGHAGLFGTAADVSALAEAYLGPLNGRANRLPLAFATEATREQAYDPVLRRGLGWALKTSGENSCGRYFHSLSFGHTGFVGTCVWADPVYDLAGVLLTNNVYFGRNASNGTTPALRPGFYEAMVDDFLGSAGFRREA